MPKHGAARMSQTPAPWRKREVAFRGCWTMDISHCSMQPRDNAQIEKADIGTEYSRPRRSTFSLTLA